jgi:uncharacterized cupredoxin-like copper-binding protein
VGESVSKDAGARVAKSKLTHYPSIPGHGGAAAIRLGSPLLPPVAVRPGPSLLSSCAEMIMKALQTCVLFLLLSLVCAVAALAQGEQHGPKPTVVTVQLGSADGRMAFTPGTLHFERGTYYKLVVSNPSPIPHYFSSNALATHVYTRKVEIENARGETLVEIHGLIHDLELAPGQSVAWYFYPMTKGTDLEFLCLKKGHKEAGMVGRFTIE